MLIDQLAPQFQAHFRKLLKEKAITIKGSECFFHSKDDPFGEFPQPEIRLIEYIVWNLAATMYKEKYDV